MELHSAHCTTITTCFNQGAEGLSVLSLELGIVASVGYFYKGRKKILGEDE